jgi:hypothetical protein
MYSGAEPEMIDRGCPVQINRIFGSKEKKILIIRYLFFSELRDARAPTGAYLEFVSGCTATARIYRPRIKVEDAKEDYKMKQSKIEITIGSNALHKKMTRGSCPGPTKAKTQPLNVA